MIIPGGGGGGGGGTWVFFGWVCAARDSKLTPRSKKKFPLKQPKTVIPRSRNGPIFYRHIFADQVFTDPTFFGIFICGPLQSLVVNVCAIFYTPF